MKRIFLTMLLLLSPAIPAGAATVTVSYPTAVPTQLEKIKIFQDGVYLPACDVDARDHARNEWKGTCDIDLARGYTFTAVAVGGGLESPFSLPFVPLHAPSIVVSQ